MDVDVSFQEEGKFVGVGIIIRDYTGRVIAAVSQPIGYTETVLMGELHAMLLGIGFALEQDIGPMVLYTDSLLAIHVVHGSQKGAESLCDDLWEAFEHARNSVVFEFRHARREANMAAHALACAATESQEKKI